jgi:hypothetical protein
MVVVIATAVAVVVFVLGMCFWNGRRVQKLWADGTGYIASIGQTSSSL